MCLYCVLVALCLQGTGFFAAPGNVEDMPIVASGSRVGAAVGSQRGRQGDIAAEGFAAARGAVDDEAQPSPAEPLTMPVSRAHPTNSASRVTWRQKNTNFFSTYSCGKYQRIYVFALFSFSSLLFSSLLFSSPFLAGPNGLYLNCTCVIALYRGGHHRTTTATARSHWALQATNASARSQGHYRTSTASASSPARSGAPSAHRVQRAHAGWHRRWWGLLTCA